MRSQSLLMWRRKTAAEGASGPGRPSSETTQAALGSLALGVGGHHASSASSDYLSNRLGTGMNLDDKKLYTRVLKGAKGEGVRVSSGQMKGMPRGVHPDQAVFTGSVPKVLRKLLQEQTKQPMASHDVIVSGRMKKPEILAHELGHAQINRNRLGRIIQSYPATLAGTWATAPATAGGVGYLTGKSENENVRTLGRWAPALASLPMLGYEAGASVLGRRRLGRLGASPEQMSATAKNLTAAWGTYAGRAIKGTAASHAGSAVGGYRRDSLAKKKSEDALSKAAASGSYEGKVSDPDSVKFKTNFQGIPIHIDRPKGFRTSGTTEKGDPWTREYKYDYGSIPKTEGGDGAGIDVFIGPDKTDEESYWALQLKEDGSFDEYKVFLGFGSEEAATEAYAAHIPKRLLKGMVTLKIDMVKAMLGIEALGFDKTSGLVQVSFLDELAKIGESSAKEEAAGIAAGLTAGGTVGKVLGKSGLARLVGAQTFAHGTSRPSAQAILAEGLKAEHGGGPQGAGANKELPRSASRHFRARSQGKVHVAAGPAEHFIPKMFSNLSQANVEPGTPKNKLRGAIVGGAMPYEKFRSTFEADPDMGIPGAFRTTSNIGPENLGEGLAGYKQILRARTNDAARYISKHPGRFATGAGMTLAAPAAAYGAYRFGKSLVDDEPAGAGAATKQAGVGWDVHGYSGDPQDFPVDLGKEPERKYEGGSQPGFFGRLLGRKPVQGKLVMTPELKAHWDAQDADDDRYERARALRIQTPFDRQTSYKANDQLAVNFAPDLWEHTTDFAYGAKPVEKRLSREDLTKVIKIYQQAASKWQPKGEDNMPQYSKAFVQKAQHLLKDPKFQFARLEYE